MSEPDGYELGVPSWVPAVEPDPGGAASFYGEETYRRLRAVKADVDRDELFLANHPILPADRT